MQLATHRILITDDEGAILFAMREYFEGLGYEVDCAQDEVQARALLATNRYAVVIADLRLSPGGIPDGLDLVRTVRSRWPATRTMIFTAYGSPEIEAEAKRLGVDAFLQKPERLQVVANIVRRLAVGNGGGDRVGLPA